LFCSLETLGTPAGLVTDQNTFSLPWENGITQQTKEQHVWA